MARHDLMDTPDTVRALLGAAGFRAPHAGLVPWECLPSVEVFHARHSAPGVIARRLNRLDPEAREEFLRSVWARLRRLPPEHFIDRRDVVIATALRRADQAKPLP